MEEHPLFTAYKKTLPAKLELLGKLIEDLKNNYNLQTMDSFRREIHKIAGNAGTYGFLNASRLCQELELNLIETIKNSGSIKPDQNWFANLEIFLKQLEKAFSSPDRPFELKL